MDGYNKENPVIFQNKTLLAPYQKTHRLVPVHGPGVVDCWRTAGWITVTVCLRVSIKKVGQTAAVSVLTNTKMVQHIPPVL